MVLPPTGDIVAALACLTVIAGLLFHDLHARLSRLEERVAAMNVDMVNMGKAAWRGEPETTPEQRVKELARVYAGGKVDEFEQDA